MFSVFRYLFLVHIVTCLGAMLDLKYIYRVLRVQVTSNLQSGMKCCIDRQLGSVAVHRGIPLRVDPTCLLRWTYTDTRGKGRENIQACGRVGPHSLSRLVNIRLVVERGQERQHHRYTPQHGRQCTAAASRCCHPIAPGTTTATAGASSKCTVPFNAN